MFRVVRLSIKSRLILMLLIVSLMAIVVIGVLGWRNGQTSLNDVIVNNLNSVRSSKAYQVERYFEDVFRHTRTLAENRMVVNAMKEFSEGYEVGLYRSTSAEQLQEISTFYEDVFLDRLAENLGESVPTVLYQPRRPVANYFQYHYIVNNPFPIGEKDEMVSAVDDSTLYNRLHQFYHPHFQSLIREYEYYDMFLIELETSTIVYSVSKETDFATSLREGPYRESGLGVLAARIRAEPQRGQVTIIDFRPYDPSYAAPAAFVGTPIFDRTEAVGVLAIQIPLDEINRVVTGGENWEDDGLGLTGETYLVGGDKLMRSDSRFYLTDKSAYFDTLRSVGASADMLRRIDLFDSAILIQPIVTDAVELAGDEQSGTQIIDGYRGAQVLSSYAPLQIAGLDWMIVSEIETSEAFAPIVALQGSILQWGVGLLLFVSFLAILLSQSFLRPIEKLTQGVKRLIEEQDETVQLAIDSRDEFGDLARSFNTMVDNIRDQHRVIDEKNQENERLLFNILPVSIARRVMAGERIAEQLQQVSIIYIRIRGFAEMSAQRGALVSAEYLDELIKMLDESAEQHRVERIRTIGETYIATCGLTTAQLDHAKRIVEFALSALIIICRFDARHSEKLTLQIGIHAGPVTAGVVGTRRFNYEVWGETVNIANEVHIEAAPNQILVTDSVRQRIGDHFEFCEHSRFEHEGNPMTVYALETKNGAQSMFEGMEVAV